MTPRFKLQGDIKDGDASRLTDFLTENPGKVIVEINSPGGAATEGAALMAEIERHGHVTAYVTGIAASAATLPMVASQEVIVHATAMVMIHEPAASGVWTADEMRDTAQTLDKLGRTYAEAYARHTGHSVARIAAWMKAETWLTADEAVELRFADRIEGAETPQMVAAFDYSKFNQPPEHLVRLALKNGWAAASPDQQKETDNAV